MTSIESPRRTPFHDSTSLFTAANLRAPRKRLLELPGLPKRRPAEKKADRTYEGGSPGKRLDSKWSEASQTRSENPPAPILHDMVLKPHIFVTGTDGTAEAAAARKPAPAPRRVPFPRAEAPPGLLSMTRAHTSIDFLRAAVKGLERRPVLAHQSPYIVESDAANTPRNPPLLLRAATASPPRPPARLKRSTSLLTPGEIPTSDRFIPRQTNASSNKLAAASSAPPPGALAQSHIRAHLSRIYQHHVAAACGLDVNSRILSFRPPPPERSKPADLFSHIASSVNAKAVKPAPALARAKRIPQAPERVLDAPSIVDDFYLNLVAWSRTNLIAIGLEDAVYVWNALTGSVGLLCETPAQKTVTSVGWAEDGLYVSVGCDDGAVEIWDLELNARLRTLTLATSRVGAHAWLLHILTAGARDGRIFHHDVRIAQPLVATWDQAHTAEVCGLSYQPEGFQLCSGSNDNTVAVWDIRNLNTSTSSVLSTGTTSGGSSANSLLFRKSNHRAAVKAMAWCPFQRLLLATGGGTSDKTIHFWNTATGARVNSIETQSQISSLNWGYAKGAGHEIVATHGFPHNSVSVFNYPLLQKTGEISAAHDLRILLGCLSPDGTCLATVAGDENLKFWNLFDAAGGSAPTQNLDKMMNLR